jgi:hypothetical protein
MAGWYTRRRDAHYGPVAHAAEVDCPAQGRTGYFTLRTVTALSVRRTSKRFEASSKSLSFE